MLNVKANSKEALRRIENELESILLPLGYEVITLDSSSPSNAKARTITLYIDFANNTDEKRRISLDDCITVNKAVDSFFDNTPLLEGSYTLEVSSPGVERPLRKTKDYERFCGRQIRVHTFRALEQKETENLNYWETHKKQKNFVGELKGLSEDKEKVQLRVEGDLVRIPLKLISKAHLEFELKE